MKSGLTYRLSLPVCMIALLSLQRPAVAEELYRCGSSTYQNYPCGAGQRAQRMLPASAITRYSSRGHDTMEEPRGRLAPEAFAPRPSATVKTIRAVTLADLPRLAAEAKSVRERVERRDLEPEIASQLTIPLQTRLHNICSTPEVSINGKLSDTCSGALRDLSAADQAAMGVRASRQ